MKIGIDARFYGPQSTGLGRYSQKLIENLERIDGNSDRQYYIFLKKENFDQFQPKAGNFHKVLADFHWYTFEEQIKFPLLLRKMKLDLMHFGHFNVSLLFRGKFIVTIHDLILFHYPTIKDEGLKRYFYFVKLWAYRKTIRAAVKRAKKVLAVSEYTRKDILENFKAKPENIVTTLEGCDLVCKVFPNQNTGEILKKYGIVKPFMLYVGNSYPHKNLDRLCLALAKVREKIPEITLVLVGGTKYFYEKLKNFVKEKNIEGVIFPGFVPDEDLDALYKETSLYVFVSLYEGFGLPPLEALAKGAPVVSSDRTCLPEVLGDAACYCNPENLDSIANACLKVLLSPELKNVIVREGINQLAKFSWEKMARETLEIYKKENK